MLVHRFRELRNSSDRVPAPAAMVCPASFVVCPSPVLFGMSALQQAQTEYLYRIAFEQAQAQVAEARRGRWPAFSVN